MFQMLHAQKTPLPYPVESLSKIYIVGTMKRDRLLPWTWSSILLWTAWWTTNVGQAFRPSLRMWKTAQTTTPLCMKATSYHEDNASVPRHVAFVCDGNSRWARQRKLPTKVGHAQGAQRVTDLLGHLQRDGISFATFYGFSTENWHRPLTEVREILAVLEATARVFRQAALDEGVRVKIIGDLEDSRIPNSVRVALQELETATFQIDNPSLTVCIAVNYGGRSDLVQATRQLVDVAARQGEAIEVTEESLAACLWTAGIPDPDLLIRTSGECRLSNFLLWNCAYAEIYFCDALWPDFDEFHWKQILEWYTTRQRRFGKRPQQKVA